MAPSATPKRSSCDCCRAQKLRCAPSGTHGSDACARCARLGRECLTTVPRKKLGRPPLSSRTATALAAISGKKSGRTSTPPACRHTGPSAVSTLDSFALTEPEDGGNALDVSNTPHQDGVSEASPLPGTVDVPPWVAEGLDPLLWENLSIPDDGSLLSSLSADFGLGQGVTTPFAASRGHIIQQQSNGRRDSSLAGPHPDPGTSDPDTLPFAAGTTGHGGARSLGAMDPVAALGCLSESLSRQLSRIKTYSWRTGSCATAELPGTPKVNGVADVLQTTSDFIKTIHKLDTPVSHGSIADGPEDADLDPRLRERPRGPDTATVLLLLSNYIQLMQIYDVIFTKVYERMRETAPNLRGRCSNAVDSQFNVAGLGLVDGPLHVMILVQVIEHHLRSLERVIGMPEEFCLFSDTVAPVVPHGILGDAAHGDIVRSVMVRMQDQGMSGASVVASLREGISKMKSLLAESS